MNGLLKITGLVGVVVAIAALALCAPSSPPQPLAGSVVKVDVGQGHGSAVHIGDGYILTAAHVVDGAKSITVKTDRGTKRDAELLWSNAKYDVAILRIKAWSGIRAARLACRVPDPGETITAAGNPSSMEFLTFHGFINGEARPIGPWAVGVPDDITIIGGMSGGPVFDDGGNVVGINVGHLVVSMGFGGSWTRVGIIVPAKTVCELQGRA